MMKSKLFEEIIQMSYEQEHADAVELAKQKFKSWLDLIIWDFIEIQEASKKLEEANTNQRFQHCLATLKDDIEILNNRTNGSPAIFYLAESNKNMVRLAGYVSETMASLDDTDAIELQKLIEKLKTAIRDYITQTGNSLYGLMQATKIWNKLSQNKKDKIMHEIDVKAEKDFNENGVSLKD